MSRIGKLPIPIPQNVEVVLSGSSVCVKGPLGKLDYSLLDGISAITEDQKIVVSRSNDTKEQKAFHGLTRALVQNMVTGVHSGFEKSLQVIGVGFSVEQIGKWLKMSLGFSHDVYIEIPKHISLKIIPGERGRKGGALAVVAHIVVSGINKEDVGKFAAEIRRVKPPENYKGKGIRYKGEYVKIKPGKKAASQ